MKREDILEEIEEIRVDCKYSNWDGEYTDPISSKAIDYILELINQLTDTELKLAEPSPSVNTRMGIEWINDNGRLLITIDKNSLLYYNSIIDGKEKYGKYNFAKEGIKQELMELIEKF